MTSTPVRLWTWRAMAAAAVSMALSGCFIGPIRVQQPLNTTVVDAQTDQPIANASVVDLSCDVHDFRCEHAYLVRTSSSEAGVVGIDGRYRWGVWVIVPGGVPVPNHFIAIWAPGYCAFVFSQYHDTVASRRSAVQRADISEALAAVPPQECSSDPALNPTRELSGGKIRLVRVPPA